MNNKLNKYNDYLVTVPVSLIAAQLIVGYGQKENYYELLFVPQYYPALIGSALIAFGIIFWVNRWSRYLDRIRPWEERPRSRLLMQLIYGVVLAMTVAVLLAAVYFALYQIRLSATVYFTWYFLPVLTFVLLINVYYCAEYITLLRGEAKTAPAAVEVLMEPAAVPTQVSVPVAEVKLEVLAEAPKIIAGKRTPEEIEVLQSYARQYDIAMVCVGTNIAYAHSAKGDLVIWDVNIKDSMAMLPKDAFFRVRRNCLVRRDIIKEVIQNNGRVEVVLVEPFKGEYVLPKEDMVGFLSRWQSE